MSSSSWDTVDMITIPKDDYDLLMSKASYIDEVGGISGFHKLRKKNAELKKQLQFSDEVDNRKDIIIGKLNTKIDVLVQKINEERKWLVDTYSTNENLRCVKECWDDFEGAIEKHDELFAEYLGKNKGKLTKQKDVNDNACGEVILTPDEERAYMSQFKNKEVKP